MKHATKGELHAEVGDVVRHKVDRSFAKLVDTNHGPRPMFSNGYVSVMTAYRPDEWQIWDGPSPFDFEPRQLVHDREGHMGIVTGPRDGIFLDSADGRVEQLAEWDTWFPVYDEHGAIIILAQRDDDGRHEREWARRRAETGC